MAIEIIVTGAAGRMGGTICRGVLADENLKLVAVIERPGQEKGLEQWESAFKSTSLEETLPKFPGAVIIDFTAREASVPNAKIAAKHGNPLVMGTTGLTAEQKEEIAAEAVKSPIFYSPNMSIGMNVLLAALPMLVQLLGDNYDMEVMEIHHKLKKDSPSGTALRLAEALAAAKDWKLDEVANYHREG
ncbi:MAG: 4-hydroxy-tetrahydrodipicolinate reductase, partial [Desulfovibrionaceae bacterium]|nr:4-hydroxy-tetrahydrodipicolinate reductase [Desulfovibrionaceae bacterium]